MNNSLNIDSYSNVAKGFRKYPLIVDSNLIQEKQFHPAMLTTIEHWDIARNWLIKLEWDSKFKIHNQKYVRDALKHRGLLLIQYFKLCEHCHSSQDALNVKISFENGGLWSSKIFIELIGLDLMSVMTPAIDPYQNNNKKQARIGIEREKLKSLRAGENLFKKDSQAVGLTQLIDVALKLGNVSDVFTKKYWNPFLKAYASHIAEMAKPCWGIGFSENEKYYIQAGRGKGKQFQGTLTDVQKALFGDLIL